MLDTLCSADHLVESNFELHFIRVELQKSKSKELVALQIIIFSILDIKISFHFMCKLMRLIRIASWFVSHKNCFVFVIFPYFICPTIVHFLCTILTNLKIK